MSWKRWSTNDASSHKTLKLSCSKFSIPPAIKEDGDLKGSLTQYTDRQTPALKFSSGPRPLHSLMCSLIDISPQDATFEPQSHEKLNFLLETLPSELELGSLKQSSFYILQSEECRSSVIKPL